MAQQISTNKLSTVTSYLLCYNGIQFLGWTSAFVIMVNHYLKNDNCSGLWKKEEIVVKFFQTIMALEILHAAIDIVRSNVALTAVQIFSRLFVVWGIIHSFARVNNSITIPILLTAWTITEMVRYSFYFMNLWSSVPYPLLWCRYTFFIVLYPIGIIGEVLTTIFALPYIKDSNRYTIELPNPVNISLRYYYFVILILLLYVPGFPQLYLHMMQQRKKVLNPTPPKKST